MERTAEAVFVGPLGGVLSILSVWIAGKYLGASTTFVRSLGVIEKIIGPERVAQMSFFIKEVPQIDWQWIFVMGILIGSFIASTTPGTSLSHDERNGFDMWRPGENDLVPGIGLMCRNFPG